MCMWQRLVSTAPVQDEMTAVDDGGAKFVCKDASIIDGLLFGCAMN